MSTLALAGRRDPGLATPSASHPRSAPAKKYTDRGIRKILAKYLEAANNTSGDRTEGRCSFCPKTLDEVQHMVAGPGVCSHRNFYAIG